MSRSEVDQPLLLGVDDFRALRVATRDRSPVSGLTHRFYRYPARFSPTFAGVAIELFSTRSDLILDPYMGGGTTVVEALARGRDVVGNDINTLSVFLTRVKTTPLQSRERLAVLRWTESVVPNLSYWNSPADLQGFVEDRRAHNLNLPRARAMKKVIALALRSLDGLPTHNAKDFVRCALLNVAQLFLNGQRRTRPVAEFRERLAAAVREMLGGLEELTALKRTDVFPVLLQGSAVNLADQEPFSHGRQANVVITSPPYPGIHMLYHRWQVDGRRETPAPYWLANCQDGRGSAYYNFADRTRSAEGTYFAESLDTLRGIRAVMKKGGVMAQLIAFSDPRRHLRRYLENMEAAGFRELSFPSNRRVWRDVPSRRWHANSKGRLNSSREVLLLHEAL